MKNILITGASTGLWLSLKLQYESQWYTVYNLSRSSNEFVCDLSDETSIKSCAQSIKAKLDIIDIIINCTGWWEIRSIDNVNWSTANQERQINTLGHALLISELRDMIKANGTDIITIGATIWHKANEYMPMYSVAKRWLRWLVDNWRAALKSTSSRVMLISPWWLDTESNIGPDGRETIISQQTNKPLATMIPTKELAEYVYHTTNLPKSMEASEIIINRK